MKREWILWVLLIANSIGGYIIEYAFFGISAAIAFVIFAIFVIACLLISRCKMQKRLDLFKKELDEITKKAIKDAQDLCEFN